MIKPLSLYVVHLKRFSSLSFIYDVYAILKGLGWQALALIFAWIKSCSFVEDVMFDHNCN
jgi:hypothetical protein